MSARLRLLHATVFGQIHEDTVASKALKNFSYQEKKPKSSFTKGTLTKKMINQGSVGQKANHSGVKVGAWLADYTGFQHLVWFF